MSRLHRPTPNSPTPITLPVALLFSVFPSRRVCPSAYHLAALGGVLTRTFLPVACIKIFLFLLLCLCPYSNHWYLVCLPWMILIFIATIYNRKKPKKKKKKKKKRKRNSKSKILWFMSITTFDLSRSKKNILERQGMLRMDGSWVSRPDPGGASILGEL